MENITFTIPVTPVTKKNHQQIVNIHGRLMVIPSPQYKKYEKECSKYLPKIETIDAQVNIKATYYMPTRRKVDLCNLHEALCDLLVHYNIVSDDNVQVIVAMDGSRALYDKENPRTEVEISFLQEENPFEKPVPVKSRKRKAG